MRTAEIEIRIGYITDAVNELSKHLPDKREDFIRLGMVKHGIYKKAEFALQNVIDICSIIHADLSLGIPESEDDIFDHLENHQVFDSHVVSIIREMKKFRNVLVHRYGEIDDALAFKTLKEDSKDFITVVKAFEEAIEKEKIKQEKPKKKPH